MTTTLITDDFEPGPARGVLVHDLLYGFDGVIDDSELDPTTFAALARIGAVILFDTVEHEAGTTRRWVTVAGAVPEAR